MHFEHTECLQSLQVYAHVNRLNLTFIHWKQTRDRSRSDLKSWVKGRASSFALARTDLIWATSSWERLSPFDFSCAACLSKKSIIHIIFIYIIWALYLGTQDNNANLCIPCDSASIASWSEKCIVGWCIPFCSSRVFLRPSMWHRLLANLGEPPSYPSYCKWWKINHFVTSSKILGNSLLVSNFSGVICIQNC